MAFVLADRVKETTATTGTGTITLGGASTQCQTFSAGVGSGNTTYYCLLDGNGTAWETGLGTVGGSGPFTLARTTVYESTNSNTQITLSSNTHTVFCDLPANGITVGTPPFPIFGSSFTAPASGALTLIGGTTNVAMSSPQTGVTIIRPTGTQTGVVMASKPTSGSFDFSAQVGVQGAFGNGSQGGAYGIGTSDGTKFSNLYILPPGGSFFASVVNVYHYNSSSSFNSAPFAQTSYWVNPYWMRIQYITGTGVANYFVSIDGFDWDQIYTETLTSFLTPSHAGVVSVATDWAAGHTQSVRIYQWAGI